MTTTSRLLQEVNLLDPKAVTLSFDAFEDLQLVIGDQPATAVYPLLTFPLTERRRYIVLRDMDHEEIGLIVDADALDGKSRAAVLERLEQIYVIPRITRVIRAEIRNQVPTWEVETDRGPRTLEIRSTRRDIRFLGGGAMAIRDADGNQYEIPDRKALDAASRAMLDTQV